MKFLFLVVSYKKSHAEYNNINLVSKEQRLTNEKTV